MKGLLLYGAYSTNDIWQPLKKTMSQFDLTFAAYPHAL